MSATCPAGHRFAAADHCDVCGMPIPPAAGASSGVPVPAASAPTGAPVLAPTDAPMAARACPHCNAPNAADDGLCAVCGHDVAAGSLPPTPDRTDGVLADLQAEGGVAWVAEVSIDPAWYQAQESPDPLPSPGPPSVRPLRGPSVLVGRTSRSRDVHPDLDCGSDSGVSRRQSELTTDGTRWWVADLDSANGTFVAPAGGPLPTDPIPVGVRHELGPEDGIYVGAWTRLVIRPATDDERGTLA